MSSLIGTNNIVTDGLATYLDAANVNSYSGSGTSWNDLSGYKNNGSLVNNPTFSSTNSGCFLFDGVDDYVSIANSSSSNFAANNFAVELWFKVNSIPANNPRIFKTTNDSNVSGISMTVANSNFIILFMSSNGSSYDLFNTVNIGTINIGTYNNLVLTRIGTSIYSYINNSLLYTGSIGTSSVYYNAGANIGIGGTAGVARTISGAIAIFKMYYNKGLTASEVSKNYNAVKGRFL